MRFHLLGSVLLLFSSFSANAMTQQIDFGALKNMTFTGVPATSFSFTFPNLTPIPGADQVISGGTPALTGDAVYADTIGTWTVAAGNIMTCGSGCQEAAISGGNPGTLRIFDYTDTTRGITASLTFDKIKSQIESGGTTGRIQLGASLNVSKFTNFGGYTTGNADLDLLKTYLGGLYFVTFNPGGSHSLSSLLTGTLSTSYSATLTMVPEPSFYSMMLAPAIAGILYAARRRKQADNV